MRPRYVVAFLAVASTAPAHDSAMAQAFAAPTTRWQSDFSRIGGVAELPDGKVVIVDSREGLVWLGSADGRAVTPIGREGDGPNEYRGAQMVFPGRQDTLLVGSRSRLLRITPEGRLGGTIPFAPQELGSIGLARGTDREGRIYWERVVIRNPETGAIKRQQQFEIVRHRPGTRDVEVVATANDHAPELHDRRFHPFAQRDAWVVDPDGTVRVLRAREYRVEWVQARRVVRTGPMIPFTPHPIDGAARESYRKMRAANPSGMSIQGPARLPIGEASPEAMARMRRDYPDAAFPSTKPPFVDRGLHRSPQGQLWVVRSSPGAALLGSTVDVLDRDGTRVRTMALPSGRQLAALGRRGVYLIHEDADGLQRLELRPWPEGLR